MSGVKGRTGCVDPAKARERGLKGKAASPWGRNPHCATPRAKRVFKENEGKGPKR